MSQAESLRLERLSLSDSGLRKTLVWRNDPEIYRWCRQQESITAESHERWYEWQEKDPHTRMYAALADRELVGICGLTSIDWINRRAEFSLYIGPEHQGKGYGEASLRALITHGFNVLNLNCIWGEAFDGNPAMKMFAKVGFKSEGVRRQFYYREGKYVDAHLFSLTRSDWSDSRDRASTAAPGVRLSVRDFKASEIAKWPEDKPILEAKRQACAKDK